jgi:hypothetical protein
MLVVSVWEQRPVSKFTLLAGFLGLHRRGALLGSRILGVSRARRGVAAVRSHGIAGERAWRWSGEEDVAIEDGPPA